MCAILFSIFWRYHSKRYINSLFKHTKTSVACTIRYIGHILNNQSVAITWFSVIINICLWSNALCLNITLMKSLIKPDCTYLMTVFVSCPFISTKKSNFNYFNHWYFKPKPQLTHVTVATHHRSVSFKSVKMVLEMSLHYWLYLKKPMTDFFHITHI